MTPSDSPVHSNPPSPRCVDGYFPQEPVPPMSLDSNSHSNTIRDLIRQLEADRRAYLSTFEKVHQTLHQALNGQPARPDTVSDLALEGILSQPLVGTPEVLPSPGLKQGTEQPAIPPLTSSQRTGTYVLERHQAHPAKDSIFSGDASSDSEDDESFFAQEALPARDYSELDLIEHLKTHEWDVYNKYILQDLLRNLSLLENGIFLKDRHHQTDANHQHADIYHVSKDGAPLRSTRGDSEEGPLAVWEALKSTNSAEGRNQAVGRIIVVREPSSSLFAALHLTMAEYFDMDNIYRMLIDDHTPTKAITKGYLEKDHRRQRSIVFVFKYHTLIGEGRAPLPWQNHDNIEDPPEGHIPLSTCSSVVALSLAGRPSHSLRRNSRKRKAIVGHIYDPFAPWHVLSIQCFPDWNSSVDVHETSHHYVNGPDAFFSSLLGEYRDAAKRFRAVFSSIQRLATPPNKSIFDRALRDELLFENDKYTYSRRYFWASQTLGLLSNEIKAMISAYRETFTDELWSGEHKTLFPGTKDQSSKYKNWRKKLVHTRRLFEKEIAHLEEVLKMFQQQQKEIRNLREWLFSGTSVLESREAVNMAKITVEQGYNIRLLTLVTLFYLPLTFVTSIYGMTNMPTEHDYLPFALTMVGICLPTYVLIVIVNNPDKTQRTLADIGLFFTKLTSRAAPKKSERLKEKILEHKLPHPDEKTPAVHAAATYASLEARLSHDLSAETSIRGSQGFLLANTRRVSQSVFIHLPGMARRASTSQAEGGPHAINNNVLQTWPEEGGDTTSRYTKRRSTTIEFEEPHYSSARVTITGSDEDPPYGNGPGPGPGQGPMRRTTGDSYSSTFLDPEKLTSTFSSVSPGVSPSRPDPNVNVVKPTPTPTPPPTAALASDAIIRSERSMSPSNPDGRSLFRRLSDRFTTPSPRPSSEQSLTPKESV
ncbi:hypothetical protein LTR47_008298 [Exophiala xenobiotica]|nr:hypothetical protein LTR47_008298 [Exophiala xenobiotica]KAK5316074.1 hypothetical protein LTR93_009402 [Exophiala xenobiotica]KAK5345652.1 hypothetical protein LTR61_010630 [Exophiala xenobiotica]KAK5361112.1 hypothetical protein LTR11_009985 [Exophiala xenobiotica]KAK5362071.1 hypothetical protein LTS03_010155 [Exophiala xenobiotica]